MPKETWFGVQWMIAIRDHKPMAWDSQLVAILFVLSTYMDNGTGDTRVSEAKLAKGAGCRRETVSRKLGKAFAESGLDRWLVRQKNTNREGHRYYIYRGLIPPEARGDSRSHRPRDSHAEPRDSHTQTHATLTHTNYLFNYLELEPDGSDFLKLRTEEISEELSAGLTPSGWRHAHILTKSKTQGEVLRKLVNGECRYIPELATSSSFFRNALGERQ